MSTQWIGSFSQDDKNEINALREAQVRSVMQADASAYAELCVEDITLMLTGYDIVSGRDEFLEVESVLLAKINVKDMQQNPHRVERNGELAFEVGRQHFELNPDGDHPEGFAVKRKYTHVLRRTRDGWRFALLMSNDSV
jgi:uncharacterized protein (TIGR02246 family)